MEEEPYFFEAKFTFSQTPNTNGSTKKTQLEDELLEITMESVTGELDVDGGFYVLRTDGWSIDNPSELVKLFQRISNIKI